MDKKTILAIVLCIGVMVGWQLLVDKPKPPAPAENLGAAASGNTTASQADGGMGQAANSQPAATQQANEEKPPVERPAERLVTMKTASFEAVWSSRGANLKSFVLKDYKASKNGIIIKDQNLDLVTVKDETGLPFGIRFQGDKTALQMPKYTDWEVVEESNERVVFRFTHPTDQNFPLVTKTYTISSDKAIIGLEVELQNRSEQSVKEKLVLDVFSNYQPPPASGGCAGCSGARVIPTMPVCMNGKDLLNIDTTPGSWKTGEPAVKWVGINEQYFLLAAIATGVDKAACRIEAQNNGILLSSLMYPETDVSPGNRVIHTFHLYAGPKQLEVLNKIQGGVGDPQKGAELGAAVDFGWTSFLAHPMMSMLKVFYAGLKNWGLAIIVLTLVMKILLIPISQWSMKTAKRMQKLKPMLDDLKKRCGDNKEKYNEEMMKVMKSHGVSPFSLGGCLPLLIQIPFWIALANILYSAVELYQTPFIPGWINDLSSKDPYYIMPLFLGITMFLQQKISPSPADTQQAKLMLYMMPVLFTFLMISLPAGLVLYIMVSSVLQILHQFVYNRMTAVPVVDKTGNPATAN